MLMNYLALQRLIGPARPFSFSYSFWPRPQLPPGPPDGISAPGSFSPHRF